MEKYKNLYVPIMAAVPMTSSICEFFKCEPNLCLIYSDTKIMNMPNCDVFASTQALLYKFCVLINFP